MEVQILYLALLPYNIDLSTIMKENNYNYVIVGKILGVSNNTVKKQYKRIFEKKNSRSRNDSNGNFSA